MREASTKALSFPLLSLPPPLPCPPSVSLPRLPVSPSPAWPQPGQHHLVAHCLAVGLAPASLRGCPVPRPVVLGHLLPLESRGYLSWRSFQSAAAAPSPVLGNIPPNDGMPGGPIPPGFFQGPPGSQPSPHAQPPPHNPSSMMGPHSQPFMSPRYAGGPRPPIRMGNQPPGGVPGTQPLLPNSMDPTRQQGHPNMGGSMQRMNPPRGMGPMGPGPQNYGSGMRPPPNSLGPAMPGINMGPGAGRPWPNPNSANSIPYSSSSPGTYVGPPGGGGPPGTPIMPSPADSTNSSDNIYTMINPVPPGGSRSNFPMGPGSDGPMGGMGGMEPHHMNGSLGSGDIDGLPKNSPNNISGISNPPGTPRDDSELGGNFLHSFQNDNYSPSMTMSV
ncbi:single-stranded DNA-binding protein 3 isoform X2 [Fukomys damarensis]|uniref:single-stranded DNA-binding protein 3 isoform X2 n=1 Tax=Fukomys damarensis TaxID=885580 RepID=UPI0014557C9E|nr:single-stranded DNA-binding protein 3 isoform X2 [Fukomys damarensis]